MSFVAGHEIVSPPSLSASELLAVVLRALGDVVFAVAGRPITATAESLVSTGHARWVNHEAVAAQMALGVSALGGGSVVLAKQVGLNAAVDVLACASSHRSGGSCLVIVGDDPGAAYSDVEGDARRIAAAIDLPCLDVAGAADIPTAIYEARRRSARQQVPVVIRLTTQLLLERCASPDVTALTPRLGTAGTELSSLESSRVWALSSRSRRELLLRDLRTCTEDACAIRPGDDTLRIVACGQPGADAIAATTASVLLVRWVVPLPLPSIRKFVQGGSSNVLVLEDGGALIEDFVRAMSSETRVLGRRTGHVPWTGPIEISSVLESTHDRNQLAKPFLEVVDSDPRADLTLYGTLFEDLEAVGLTPVALDAGHCFAAIWLPYRSTPVAYGLGSSIGVAAGLALGKQAATVAVIGDMAVFHAGVLGLLQVVRDQLPVLVVIGDNGTSGYTGGQPHPGSEAAEGQVRVQLRELLKGLGMNDVTVISAKEAQSNVIRPLLREHLRGKGPSALIIEDRPEEN